VVLLAVVTAFSFSLTSAPGAKAAVSGFVQRCGIHFCVNGATTYFAGANSYDLFTFGSGSNDTETLYMDKTAIDAQMANMAADGVTLLRTWMFDHESWHGFEPTRGVMNEQEWSEFDYILYSASQHNIRVIPVLEGYWAAYGGIGTILGWNGLPSGDPANGAFFDPSVCAGCLADYEFEVNYALNRVNHYTGVAYKNDPTIFSWELMNEPRHQNQTVNPDNTTGTIFRAWEDKVGAYIRTMDTNHMIDNGIEGQGSAYGYGGDNGVPFVYECQSAYIDFCSAHIYPTEGWANLTVAATQTLVARYISDAHNTAGKPMFLGEFNVTSSVRSTYWSAIYSTMETNNGDADAFWWYMNSSKDGLYGVMHGDAALSVFTAHSNADKAKSGTPTTTASPSASPTRTPAPSASPTRTPAPSASPTRTPAPSASASGTPTPSASPTRTPAPSASASGTPTPSATPTPSGSGSTAAKCSAAFAYASQWSNGFTTNVTVTNTGTVATKSWKVTWTWGGNQAIVNSWNAIVSSSGTSVTVTNQSYNAVIAPNGTTSFGLQASFSGTITAPTLACSAT
jgi:mannan endo-1,4-beta-mannosidase